MESDEGPNDGGTETEIFRNIRIEELDDHADDSELVFIPDPSDDEGQEIDLPPAMSQIVPDTFGSANFTDEFSSQEGGLDFNMDAHDTEDFGMEIEMMSQEVVNTDVDIESCRNTIETCIISDIESMGQNTFEAQLDIHDNDSQKTIEYELPKEEKDEIPEKRTKIPNLTSEEEELIMEAASKILGEIPNSPPSTSAHPDPVPPKDPIIPPIEAPSELPPAAIFERRISSPKPSTSKASEHEQPPRPAPEESPVPSVSQISNDHDYLFKKIAHLQRSPEDNNAQFREKMEEIKKKAETFLSHENPDMSGTIKEIAHVVDQLIYSQEIVEPEHEFLHRELQKDSEGEEDDHEMEEGELISTIIKEEYQMVDLPPNEPEIDEMEDDNHDHDMNEEIPLDFDDESNEFDAEIMSKACGAAFLKDFAARIVEESDTLVLKSSDEVSSFFQRIREQLEKVEKEFGIQVQKPQIAKTDAEVQVSRKEFLKLNEAAKEALLNDVSSDESDVEAATAAVEKVKAPKKKVEDTPTVLEPLEDIPIVNEPVVETLSQPIIEKPESIDYDLSDKENIEENDANHASNSDEDNKKDFGNLLEPEIGINEDSNEFKLSTKSDEDSDSDDEIDRLIDLSNLEKKRETRDDYMKRPKALKAVKAAENNEIEQLLMNGINGHGNDSAGSDEDSESEMTEEQFLSKQNEFIRMQLLEESSASEIDDDDRLSVDSSAKDSSDLEENDSDASMDLVDRFFAKMNEKNNQDEAMSEGDESDVDEEKRKKSSKRKLSVDSTGGSARKIRRKSGDATDESDSDESAVLDLSMFQEQQDKIHELDKSKTPISTEIAPEVLQPVATSPVEDNKTEGDDHISLSSDSDTDSKASDVATSRRHRKIIGDDQLAKSTRDAEKEEEERIKRLTQKKETITQKTQEDPTLQNQLVLDYDTEAKQAVVVHPLIANKLKNHQKEGVKFMYQCCYGDINKIDRHPGSGCILAHCMGLGKTLQLIALLHTLIQYPKLKTSKVLVICPKSTILNWSDEFNRWVGEIRGKGPRLKVYCFGDGDNLEVKVKKLEEWHRLASEKRFAGCFLVGYEAFRQLVNFDSGKRRQSMNDEKAAEYNKKIEKYLLSPGADLVVCDEGHMIKNQKSAINQAVQKIKTKRRIILTGTPIQNNLNEYYCMVNFIKPSFLGTEKEFNNRYALPIKAGQHADSTNEDIRNMKRRAFVLHKKLVQFVQRKEASILKEFLPEKHEYVLSIPLTKCQEKIYEMFLNRCTYEGVNGGKTLLPDYTFLRKIWTHPRVLDMAFQDAKKNKQQKETKSLDKIIKALEKTREDEDMPDDSVFDIGTEKNSVLDDWWRSHIRPEDFNSILPSCKLQVMLEILRLCRDNKEKCLIFSGYVAVLNVVEYFFQRITYQESNPNAEQEGLTPYRSQKWVKGMHYYRLDGKTEKKERHRLINEFNKPNNDVVCFLISARAGGQGINLIGANRVIILDTSWNPSSDQQNIFRIYRLGQKKPCYVYRLLAMGTMEERVYSRSVNKQAMSFRVVDEKQIDRHYNYSELAQLYELQKVDLSKRPIPKVPADSLLRSLLHHFPNLVYKYHEHDSLLENKPEEDLTEEEKREAWTAFEREEEMEKQRQTQGQLPQFPSNMLGINAMGNFFNNNYGMLSNYAAALQYPNISASPQFGALYNFANAYMNPYMNPQLPPPPLGQPPANALLGGPSTSRSMGPPPPSHPGLGGMPDFASSSLFQTNPVTLDPNQSKRISPDVTPILNKVAQLASSASLPPSRSSPSSRASPSMPPQLTSTLARTLSPALSSSSPSSSIPTPPSVPSLPSPQNPHPHPSQLMRQKSSSSIPMATSSSSAASAGAGQNNGANRPRGRPTKTSFEREFQQKIGVPASKSPPIIEIPDDPLVRIEPPPPNPKKVTNIGIYNPKNVSTGISVMIPENITVNKIAKMPSQTQTSSSSSSSSSIRAPNAAAISNHQQQQRQLMQNQNRPRQRPSNDRQPNQRPAVSHQGIPRPQIQRQHSTLSSNNSPVTIRPSNQQFPQKQNNQYRQNPRQSMGQQSNNNNHSRQQNLRITDSRSLASQSSSSGHGVTLTQIGNSVTSNSSNPRNNPPNTRIPSNVAKLLPKQLQNSVTVTPVMQGSANNSNAQNQQRMRQVPHHGSNAVQIQRIQTQQQQRRELVPSETIYSSGPPSKLTKRK